MHSSSICLILFCVLIAISLFPRRRRIEFFETKQSDDVSQTAFINALQSKNVKKVTFDGNVQLREFDANAKGIDINSKRFLTINDEDRHLTIGDTKTSSVFPNKPVVFNSPTTISSKKTTVDNAQFQGLAHFKDVRINGDVCFYNKNKSNCISKSDVEALSDKKNIDQQLDKMAIIRGACTSASVMKTDSDIDKDNFTFTDDMICKAEQSGIYKLENWYDENYKDENIE